MYHHSEHYKEYKMISFKLTEFENNERTAIESQKSIEYNTKTFEYILFDIRQLATNTMKGKFINYDVQNHECLQLEDLSNYEVNYDINKIESFSKTPIYVRSSDTQINAIDIPDIKAVYECNVCFNYI